MSVPIHSRLTELVAIGPQLQRLFQVRDGAAGLPAGQVGPGQGVGKPEPRCYDLVAHIHDHTSRV